MLTRARLSAAALLALFPLLLCGGGDPASAHWSASQGTSLYVVRYAACSRDPMNQPRCVGLRAEEWIMKSLVLPELTGGRNNDEIVDPAHQAALAAVYFNLRDAVPRLRKILAIRIQPADRDEHVFLEKNGLRAQAAYALAHLGDKSSAAQIRALVREFEVDGHGTLWIDTLDALSIVDPTAAAVYATEFYTRVKGDWNMSMPGGTSKTAALRYLVRANHRPAIEVLRKLTADEGRKAGLDDDTFCQMIGTRVALGDEPLHTELHRRMLESYGGSWLANCQGNVLEGLGVHPDDAAALVRHLGRPDRGMDYGATNRSYKRILHLLVRMRDGDGRARDPRLDAAEESLRDGLDELEQRWPEATSDAKIQAARAVIKKGLRERSRWPHIANKEHANYSLHFVAMHMAALAALGDGEAQKTLDRIIDDDKDTSGTAWMAAYWALRLRLPGARERAARLIDRGVAYDNDEHTGLFQGIRQRVLNAYAASYPSDGRWAVMLLEHEQRDAAERALYLLSRYRPQDACQEVVRMAPKARPEAVEWAFLSLTALGQTCRGDLEELAKDAGAAAEVRGPALEMLASFGAEEAGTLIERVKNDPKMRVYRERAVDIYAAARQR